MDLAHFWNTSGAYQINQSLRFDGATNCYLRNASLGIYGNTNTTISFWLKHSTKQNGNIFACGTNPNLWSLEIGPSSSGGGRWLNNGGTIYVFPDGAGKLRDPAAWYHIVLRQTGNQSTIFVNGVQTNNNNSNSAGTNTGWYIGNEDGAGNNQLDGYIAEFVHVDGTAYDPSYFGEFDSITGAWIPKKISGITYGTKGFYLKFDPSATNGIGHDHSGNGNNFTATGFSTSGTGTDVMSDTPTNNWCTLNPLYKPATSSIAPRNGNLEIVADSTGYDQVRIGTHAFSSGKWYWEYRMEGTNNYGAAGIIDPTTTAFHDMMRSSTPSLPLTGGFKREQNGTVSSAGISNVSSGSISNGTVAMFAVDYNTGKVWVGTAGSWYNSGDPAAGTNPTITIQTLTTAVPFFSPTDTGSQTYYINWGQRAFEYTPPTGYKALNTANLPEPTIKKGSKYMDVLTWSGTGGGSGATRSLTGLGFSPDFVWGKIRTSSSPGHILMDSVRGVGTGKYLQSNTTNAEGTSGPNEALYGYLSSLDSAGFTVTNGTSTFDNWNKSGDTYVAWAWDANGSGSSNTAGSITSTVSANATAGFSIVTYTGNATAGATVGHGLGVAPKMIICKRRQNNAAGTSNWQTYHASLGATKLLYLNTTTDALTGDSPWNNTAPTSTVFTLGDNPQGNPNGDNVVAYCFSEVAGYSKFGSYTGNGSSDGVFIHLGFKPAFFMWKVTNTTGSWGILDFKRDTYNVSGKQLFPNQSDAEASYTVCDLLSNGIKMRNMFGDTNGSGSTYIFAAFAELPFKYANAR